MRDIRRWRHCLTTSAPLLVIAGVGSGKTNTLAPAAHFVVTGIDPHGIQLIAFSRRAAGETRRRVERIAASIKAILAAFASAFFFGGFQGLLMGSERLSLT